MRNSASPRPSERSAHPAAHLPTATLEGLQKLRHNSSSSANDSTETLEQCVLRSLDQYFVNLDGAKPHALHEMVLQAVERPLLRFAMQRCEGNQSAAAQLLGINRNTLRKKLSDYGLGE